MLKKLPKAKLASETGSASKGAKRLKKRPTKSAAALLKIKATPPAGQKRSEGLTRRYKTTKTKRRLAKIIELTSEGYSTKHIALVLTEIEGEEVTPKAINQGLYRLRKMGEFNDTQDRLTHQAAPLAAEVVIERLEEGDKMIALETLKGLGLFRNYTQQKNEGGQSVAALQVVFQDGGRDVAIKAANIVGVPQTGEVVDA